MEWQEDGELARTDLHALVNALQQVEGDHASAEQSSGQLDSDLVSDASRILSAAMAAPCVVDVDDNKAGSTTGKHAVKSGSTSGTDAVADGHRNSDDRLGDQSSQDGRQGTLHAGASDQNAGGSQAWQCVKQAMQTGHPHVHDRIHPNPMATQSQAGFRHDPTVAAASTEHCHLSRALRR